MEEKDSFIEINPIQKNERRSIVNSILATHNRELSEKVIEEIINKPSSDNPLYLSLLVQRMTMMNKEDFDQIVKMGDGMDAIIKYQRQIVADSPELLPDMTAELLRIAGQRMNENLVNNISLYIAMSRFGLRMNDLAGLLGNDFNYLHFAHFISYMSNCFILRSDGRYDFAHKSIREGFQKKCLTPQLYHHRLYKYFAGLDDSDEIKHQEISYHCIMSGDKDAFLKYVSDYDSNEFNNKICCKLAHNLYETSIQDKGHWLLNLLDQCGNREEDVSLIRLLVHEYDNLFEDNAQEQEILFQVRKKVVSVAEQICQMFHGKKYRHVYGFACLNCARSWEKQKSREGKCTALRLKEKALYIRKQLQEEKNSENNRKKLAYAYSELGYTYLRLEENEKALAMHEKAMLLWQELAAEYNTIPIKRNLADTYNDIGITYQGSCLDFVSNEEFKQGISVSSKKWNLQKRNNTALEWFQKALALQEEIMKEEPTILNRDSLSASYHALATLYSDFEGSDARYQALELYEREIELLSNCSGEEQASNYLKMVSRCDTAGVLYENGGSTEELQNALRLFQKAQNILERLSWNWQLNSVVIKAQSLYMRLKIIKVLIKSDRDKNWDTIWSFYQQCRG